MNKYTVVFSNNGGDTCYEFVEADNPTQAYYEAIRQYNAAQSYFGYNHDEDATFIITFEGHLKPAAIAS